MWVMVPCPVVANVRPGLAFNHSSKPLKSLTGAVFLAEITNGLICDTQQQVEQFIALYDGNAQGTAEKVNAAEHNPTACVVSGMAYVRGRNLATARTKDTTFQIVPILVVGVVTGSGIQAVAPARFFSAIEVKEIAV